jgi:hypothetical protein
MADPFGGRIGSLSTISSTFAAVLQTTPESRSGLSLAHSDCPSPNSLNGVNVPWPTPSIRSELLTSSPFDFELHSSHCCGEDQHAKSVARRQKSRVSIFTALVLPLRTLRPSGSTRKCRSTQEAYLVRNARSPFAPLRLLSF